MTIKNKDQETAFGAMCGYLYKCNDIEPGLTVYTAVYLAACYAFDCMPTDGSANYVMLDAIRDAMDSIQDNRKAELQAEA